MHFAGIKPLTFGLLRECANRYTDAPLYVYLHNCFWTILHFNVKSYLNIILTGLPCRRKKKASICLSLKKKIKMIYSTLQLVNVTQISSHFST